MLTWARNHLMKAMSLSASIPSPAFWTISQEFRSMWMALLPSITGKPKKSEEPENTGTNFFSQRLFPSLGYYCLPPPGIMLATILHLAMFRVTGLLVVPVWPSSSFWSSIAPDGRHLPTWAVRRLRFRASFLSDPEIVSSTFKNPPTFDTLVIKFDFSAVSESELSVPNLVPNNCILGGCSLCQP